jgi:DNA-binding IclR family transcriptional regulator
MFYIMVQKTQKLNSVQKALTLLSAFDDDHFIWGVRELSGHLGYSPATVQRLLQTLKTHGFIDQDPDSRQYRLGTVYYRFLHTLQTANPLRQTLLPYLRKLQVSTRETVHLNVIDRLERLCIESLESTQHLKGSMVVGNRSPLYAGASSKCLLAFSTPLFIDAYLSQVDPVSLTSHTITNVLKLQTELMDIRRVGYASSLGERTEGLGSLSAPILDHNGAVVVAVSLAIPELRFQDAAHRTFCLESLLTVSLECSRQLGFEKISPSEITRPAEAAP